MSTQDSCLVCKVELNRKPQLVSRDAYAYDCTRCGRYIARERHIELMLREQPEKFVLLSRAIYLSQGDGDTIINLTDNVVQSVLANDVPAPQEQVDASITWMGNKSQLGKYIHCGNNLNEWMATIAAPDSVAIGQIMIHLGHSGLGEFKGQPGTSQEMRLSIAGWQRHGQLTREAIDSRRAFMAMPFNDKTLDRAFTECFQPAAKTAGFDLSRIDKKPKAGLINNHMLVEIRRSRFMIADLTHQNVGAYWEAGFADGIGRPVIYTCSQEYHKSLKKDKLQLHFDIRNHQCVFWGSDDFDTASRQIADIIRATLPGEAKLDNKPD